MISAFFRCNCPYVGYIEKKIDYVNQNVSATSKQEMTYIGYTLFHTSGSYMVLGKFDGHQYFHSRQSKSTALDDQNRPVRNNVVFVSNAPDDDLTVRRLALYALFQEEEFYKEIAAMISLHEGSFSVDYAALEAFLNKFKLGLQGEFTSHKAKMLFTDISSRKTADNSIDFVVLEADLDYFNKQVGKVLNVKHPLTYTQMQVLSGQAHIIFPISSENEENSTGSEAKEERNALELTDGTEPEPSSERVPSEKQTDSSDSSAYEPDISDRTAGIVVEEKKNDDEFVQAASLPEHKFANDQDSNLERRQSIKIFLLGLVTGAAGAALVMLLIRWLS